MDAVAQRVHTKGTVTMCKSLAPGRTFRPMQTPTRTDLRASWNAAIPWDSYFRDHIAKHRTLWEGVYRLHRTPEWAVEQAAQLPGPVRLLTLSEDWCGDAANTVPVIAALAEHAPNLELRLLKRDENLELMDQYLTGTARSIPLVIVLDAAFRPVARWGPRPSELQQFVLREKRAGVRPSADIYRDVRRWYARDRGETTLREVLQAAHDALAPEGEAD